MSDYTYEREVEQQVRKADAKEAKIKRLKDEIETNNKRIRELEKIMRLKDGIETINKRIGEISLGK